MKEFKFRVGQTVYSPFGVVKIIHRWHGKSNTFYDVKFINGKSGDVRTETWTFEEHEMIKFSGGGVALNDDDAAEVLEIQEVNGELIATISVWVQVEIGGEFYFAEKQFKEKLVRQKCVPQQNNV